MSEKCVLSIDQGTTSSRAILFRRDGSIRGIGRSALPQHYPQPGFVEHDPMEIWSGVQKAVNAALLDAQIDISDVAVIGITNQRETTVVWERETGRPICPAIVWQSRQTEYLCERYRSAGVEPFIRDRTGLVIDPYFSATKLRYILDHIPGAIEQARAGNLCFGTVDSWLVWNLTGGTVHATDASNAARTMLYNIHTGEWDDELLTLFDIPRCMLPQVKNSSDHYGFAAMPGGTSVPIGGVAGDQHAALFGQACTNPGSVKNTYGTGCFMMMQTGRKPVPSQNGLLTTVAWQLNDRLEYALEGSVFVAGAAIGWLRDALKLIDSAAASEAMAAEVSDNGGVYFVPAFVGLGAPHWDAQARGAFYGLTGGTKSAHIVRATLEAIAYQTCDVLRAMEQDIGKAITELRVDGGAAENNWLMQFQSDLLGANVLRPTVTETTALGAALFAGLSVGFWANAQEAADCWRLERQFTPLMERETRNTLYCDWLKAVERTISR